MPTVSIIGNASHGNAAFINGQTNFYTGANRATSGEIGIQISIPLFDGLSTMSKKREALALKDKAQDDIEDARRSAALDAQQAFLGVRDGQAQVSALRTAQRSAAFLATCRRTWSCSREPLLGISRAIRAPLLPTPARLCAQRNGHTSTR
ncbi:TolC family protein [Paraburkholderia domus]|nr:TolC family protein [Paraburkholderia domus]